MKTAKRKARFKVGQAVDLVHRRIHIEQVQPSGEGYVYYCDDGNVYEGSELVSIRREMGLRSPQRRAKR